MPHAAQAQRAPLSRRKSAVLVALGLGLGLLGGCGQASPPPPPAPAPGLALPEGLDTTVDRVVDGDTIVVAGDHTIRLIGIDTPETVHPERPVECFGRQASQHLAALLPPGTGVRLVGDVEPADTFGRTLAYAYRLPDGLFVNAELVRGGYAVALTISPNVAFADRFAALATEARDAGRGLWAACDVE